MHRESHRRAPARAPKRKGLSLDAANLRLLGIGVGVLGLGYLLLAQGPYNSFWSLTLAPVVLLLGYLVIIPAAILWRGRKRGAE
ncbi:MAG: hypothetical protein ONB23_00325 [candidate division KSB1 bacterium]|nr:hypothetical protein [candidate division KSB1 bacterium]